MSNNTNYGSSTLNNNTGNNNSGFGAYSLYNNTNANNNVGIGSNTLFYNTTGNNNTAVGSGSMCNNVSGSLNVAIGSSALEGVTSSNGGSNNVAIGTQTLYENTGNFNTAVGAYAALNNDGSFNTFLGANTAFDTSSNNYAYSTAVGYGAKITGSNQIVLGGTGPSGYPNVIVPGYTIFSGGTTGTTSTNTSTISITDASNNNAIYYPTFVGTSGNVTNAALYTTSNLSYDPSFSTFLLSGGIAGGTGPYIQLQGVGSQYSNVGINFRTFSGRTGGSATVIRAVDNGNYSSDLQLLTSTKGSASNPAQVSMIIQPQITGNAYVGIGTTGPAYNLDVSGNINCSTNVTIGGLASYPSYDPSSYNNYTLVTKEYVDNFVSGISIKASVLAATTPGTTALDGSSYDGSNNITGVTSPLILDDITIYDGSSVLIKDPSDNIQNGTYVWDLSNNQLTRRYDFAYGDDATSAYVFVSQGTTNGRTAWVQDASSAIVGVNPLTFVNFYTFDYKLGNGLSLDNDNYSYLNVDNSLNFINYLDSVIGPSGSNGTLNIGSLTNTLNIGNPIVGSSYFVNFLNGVTGPTGSFGYLNVANTVGIGTNSPTYPLDVSGNEHTTGYIYPQGGIYTGINTVTPTQLSYVNGVTSNIQTQLNTNATNIGYLDASYGYIEQQILTTTGNTYTLTSYNCFLTISGNTRTVVLPTASIGTTSPYLTGGAFIQIWNNTGAIITITSGGGIFTGPYPTSSNASITLPLNQIILVKSDGFNWIIINNGPWGANANNGSTNIYTTIGNVGIGTVSPAYALDVSGNINCSGTVTATSFTTTSDYRIKQNVESLSNNSNNTYFTVDNLRPVSYYNTLSKKQSIGFIADEVQYVFPFLAEGEKDAIDANGKEIYQSVDYSGIIPILVKEIQELKREVQTLKDLF